MSVNRLLLIYWLIDWVRLNVPPTQYRSYGDGLIYWPRKDERLSWPSWLTYSGWFTHIVVTRRLQSEHRTGSVHWPKTSVLPTVLHNQDCWSFCAVVDVRYVYWVFMTMFVDVRMNVVQAASITLKKLLSTKAGSAFITSYAKCQNGTLVDLLHPFKHDARKKVWFAFLLLEMYSVSQKSSPA